jgi:GNAT superfamily N-acetyltransferase
MLHTEMLFTTTEMAERLEEGDVVHLAHHAEACHQIFPAEKVLAQPVGRGVAAVTLPWLGTKLNRVIGFGMGRQVKPEDLAFVEKLYWEKGIATQFNVSPHANATVLQVLASGGYGVDSWINNYARAITDEDVQDWDDNISGIKISHVTPDRFEEFIKCSVEGFKSNGRAEKLLETYARIAVLRPDTHLYFATIDGKVAGSAGLALIETSKGGVAHLYIDSTMPEYRGRGIQAALLRARLSDARKAGYDLASVDVRPGVGSSRNIERAGFRLAYTTALMTRHVDEERRGFNGRMF